MSGTIDLGKVVGPIGPQGATGPAGPQGIPGPNTISEQTTSLLNGVLYADGSRVKPTFVSNPNLIRNGYFIGGGSQQGNGHLPINRNGTTVYTARNSGTIDNFYISSSDVNNGAMIVESDGIVMVQNDQYGSGGTYFQLLQDISQCEILRGKQVTLSILVTEFQKSDSGTIEMRIGQKTGNTTAYPASKNIIGVGLFSITAKLNTTFDTLIPYVCRLDGTGVETRVKIAACKLELGIMQTLAHQENSTWVLNQIPDYNEQLILSESQYDKTFKNRNFGQAMTSNMVSNPNLVQNWYFEGGSGTRPDRLPVNTQGLTVYQGDRYALDRWWLRGSGITLTLQDRGIELNCPNLVTSTLHGFNQALEIRPNELIGKTVTMSGLYENYQAGAAPDSYPKIGFYAADSPKYNSKAIFTVVINGNGLFSATHTFTESDFTNTSTNTLFTYAVFAPCYFAGSGTGKVRLRACKVEFGDIQTLAHMENGEWIINERPNYEDELIRCQTSKVSSLDPTSYKTLATTDRYKVIDTGSLSLSDLTWTSVSGGRSFLVTMPVPDSNEVVGYRPISATINTFTGLDSANPLIPIILSSGEVALVGALDKTARGTTKVGLRIVYEKI